MKVHLRNTKSLSWDGTVISSRGQVTRTDTEPVPSLQTFSHYASEAFVPRYDSALNQKPYYGGSSWTRFEPETSTPKPRPYYWDAAV
ncbi:hypothetical protein AVEN_57827-1 [Araneus ventricosus]|uniref:Uncharacterized protein n=1 Tax=Araneus ventricosus TaxID=182803 RepID=A0A4Y2I9T3_ARAVE|nr:hypothetical protein AVEN_57827-1 [Araneus ventricosus]